MSQGGVAADIMTISHCWKKSNAEGLLLHWCKYIFGKKWFRFQPSLLCLIMHILAKSEIYTPALMTQWFLWYVKLTVVPGFVVEILNYQFLFEMYCRLLCFSFGEDVLGESYKFKVRICWYWFTHWFIEETLELE